MRDTSPALLRNCGMVWGAWNAAIPSQHVRRVVGSMDTVLIPARWTSVEIAREDVRKVIDAAKASTTRLYTRGLLATGDYDLALWLLDNMRKEANAPEQTVTSLAELDLRLYRNAYCLWRVQDLPARFPQGWC